MQRLDPNDPDTRTISFRVTGKDFKRAEAMAKHKRHRSLSAYCREMLLGVLRLNETPPERVRRRRARQ